MQFSELKCSIQKWAYINLTRGCLLQHVKFLHNKHVTYWTFLAIWTLFGLGLLTAQQEFSTGSSQAQRFGVLGLMKATTVTQTERFSNTGTYYWISNTHTHTRTLAPTHTHTHECRVMKKVHISLLREGQNAVEHYKRAWMDEWLNEWLNEWMNGWMAEMNWICWKRINSNSIKWK